MTAGDSGTLLHTVEDGLMPGMILLARTFDLAEILHDNPFSTWLQHLACQWLESQQNKANNSTSREQLVI